MRNVRWNVVGMVVLNLSLMVLAGMMHNWFALCALIAVFLLIHIMIKALFMVVQQQALLNKAQRLLEVILEDMRNGDTKD